MDEMIIVDVAWVAGDRARLHSCSLQKGACVADALASMQQQLNSPIGNLDECTVGIFGRVVPRDHALKEGDRVEIYRPLPNDPKTARRQRARQSALHKIA